jgi:hypothetical protein
MLALNRSLLNREYIVMNVLKAWASIICICNLHVILLSNSTLFTNGIFRPFNLRRESGGLFRLVKQIARVLSSLILIFQCLHQAAIAFSEHNPPCGLLHIDMCYLDIGVGVRLAADSQSTSKSGYQASFWDP